MDNKKANPQLVDRYIKSVIKKMEDDPDSLDRHERRMIQKYSIHKQKTVQLQRDLDQMKSQITQAEARVRSLELQVQSESAKADNCIELLASLKFEEEPQFPPPPSPPANGAAAKGNGKVTPAAKPKSKRTKKKAQQPAAQA